MYQVQYIPWINALFKYQEQWWYLVVNYYLLILCCSWLNFRCGMFCVFVLLFSPFGENGKRENGKHVLDVVRCKDSLSILYVNAELKSKIRKVYHKRVNIRVKNDPLTDQTAYLLRWSKLSISVFELLLLYKFRYKICGRLPVDHFQYRNEHTVGSQG